MAGNITWIFGPALGKTTWARASERELRDRRIPTLFRTGEELLGDFVHAVTHGIPATANLKAMKRLFVDDFDLTFRGKDGCLVEFTEAFVDMARRGSRIFLLARNGPTSFRIPKKLLDACTVVELRHRPVALGPRVAIVQPQRHLTASRRIS